MPSKFLIYGLVDPRDGQLRYVGKSTSGLRRPRSHWYPRVIREDRTLVEKQVSALVVEYGLGRTAPELAARFGVGTTSIYRWLDEAGVDRRSRWQ